MGTMGTYIGTCSWTDRSLIRASTFYPKGVSSAEARLRYYASIFPTVEVDSSYYSLPTTDTTKAWVERTPPGFIFHVKAFRLFTLHWAEPRVLPPDLRPLAPDGKRFYYASASNEFVDGLMERFIEALLPLDSAGKLGLVLLQFPQWVTPKSENRDHILAMKEALSQFNVAVEFRNHTWLNGDTDKTLHWLEDNGLTFVCVDEPQGFVSSVPPLAAVSSDVAYVRFHGRNGNTWEARTQSSAERFDWYYREEELREWTTRVYALQEQAREVHLLFNTNNQDQGPYNAIKLGRMLGQGLGDESALRAAEERMQLSAPTHGAPMLDDLMSDAPVADQLVVDARMTDGGEQ